MSENKIQLRLVEIQLISKKLNLPKSDSKNQEVKFNFFVETHFSPERKLALVETKVNMVTLADDSELADFDLLCMFEFPEFDKIFHKNEEGKVELPTQIEILLKSTGLSTMRGVMYSELRGTYLQNAVLPMIDIASIVIDQQKKQNEVVSQ